jgi:hypothetical protein
LAEGDMRERKEHPIRFFALTTRLHDASDVSAVLRILLSFGGHLTPAVYGYTDPPRTRFDASLLDEVGKRLAEGGMLMLRMPSSTLTLSNHISDYAYGLFSLGLTRDALQPAELQRLVCEISTQLQPEIGFVHLLNDHDRETDVRKGMRLDGTIPEPHFGLHYKNLALGLPEFYWGMVFGRPYTALLGEAKLKQVPAHHVETPAEGVVYVQLTENIDDCWDAPEELKRAREVAKEHLGRSAFMHEKLRPNEWGNLELPWFTRLLAPNRLVPPLRP